jgi:maltooligosyltrehalose trehalohydrolase
VEAVRKGRKAEFAYFNDKGETPDPQAEEKFIKSTLNWSLLNDEPHKTMLNYYRELIAIRKELPALKKLNRKQLKVEALKVQNSLIVQRWEKNQLLICIMNFSPVEQAITNPTTHHKLKKNFDSADPKWDGPAASSNSISAGSSIIVQPESLLIYSN